MQRYLCLCLILNEWLRSFRELILYFMEHIQLILGMAFSGKAIPRVFGSRISPASLEEGICVKVTERLVFAQEDFSVKPL